MKKSKNSSNNLTSGTGSVIFLEPKGATSLISRPLTPSEIASMKKAFRNASKYMKGRFKHLAPKNSPITSRHD